MLWVEIFIENSAHGYQKYGLWEDVLRKEYDFVLPIDDETVVMDRKLVKL